VDHATGDHESLSRIELNGFGFEVDEKLALHSEKEFVVVVMFVPVIFAFNDADAYNGIVDSAERLVEPLEILRLGNVDVDDFKRAMKNIQASLIGEIWCGGHVNLLAGG